MNKLTAVLLTLSLSACHPLFCSWDKGYNQLKQVPNESRIAGLYKLAGSSVEYLNKEGYHIDDCKLSLTSDGGYNLEKAPDNIFSDFGHSDKTTVDKKGKWTVNCDKSNDCLIELEGICVVPFSERHGTLAIPITIGDGDECQGIIFERVD